MTRIEGSIRSNHVQRTRLLRPRLPGSVLARRRLESLLDRAVDHPRSLVLGPAGYGKTALVGSWIATANLPIAWLSIDPDDNNQVRFLLHLVVVLDQSAPGLHRAITPLIDARVPAIDIGRAIASETSDLEEMLLLVLDDVHLITDGDALALIEGLLDHPLPHLRVIITSRFDPVSLSVRARIRGHLLEIRPDEPRFLPDEAADIMAATTGVRPSPIALARLVEATDGWAACLRLAALAAGPSPDPDDFGTMLGDTGSRASIGHLLDQLLASLTPAIATLALRISILERVDPHLAAAMMPGSDPAEIASALERTANDAIVLTRVDDAPGWHRPLPVFRDLLAERLLDLEGAAAAARLHAVAGRWFAEQGDVDHALRHALQAGDLPGAVAVDVDVGERAFADERWQAVPPILARFSSATVDGRPDLLFLRMIGHLA